MPNLRGTRPGRSLWRADSRQLKARRVRFSALLLLPSRRIRCRWMRREESTGALLKAWVGVISELGKGGFLSVLCAVRRRRSQDPHETRRLVGGCGCICG
ncbi:hypothetical protein LY76DRAFT_151270 [Colletotrichum caudatum]|nr:hypothetical protein LY76DRAFT_151270 [Colletotrichum caudatum]